MGDERLDRLKRDFELLRRGNDETLEALISSFENVASLLLPEHTYSARARKIEFTPLLLGVYPDPHGDAGAAFAKGRRQMIELIDAVQEHLNLVTTTGIGTTPLDSATIERIARLICGDNREKAPKYRTGESLTRFFSDAGLPDIRHDGSSRNPWVTNALTSLAWPKQERAIKRLALRKEYDTDALWEQAVQTLNEILRPEDLEMDGDPRTPRLQRLNSEQPPPKGAAMTTAANNRRIFVVHGRNTQIRDAMFDFLRAIDLSPIEWQQAVMATGSGTPYTGDVVEKAIREAAAVIVLLTPEDEARLLPDYQDALDPLHEKNLTPQARPNVIFEAGMAFGVLPDKTVIIEFGMTRPMTDVVGRNTIRFKNSAEFRYELASRLEGAGIPVDRSGSQWLRAGNFGVTTTETAVPVPKPSTSPTTVTTQSTTTPPIQKGGAQLWVYTERPASIQGGPAMLEVYLTVRNTGASSARDFSIRLHWDTNQAQSKPPPGWTRGGTHMVATFERHFATAVYAEAKITLPFVQIPTQQSFGTHNIGWSISWEDGHCPDEENAFMPLSDSPYPTGNRATPYSPLR